MVEDTKSWVRRISSGEPFSPKKIQKSNAWLARHKKDTQGVDLDRDNPTPGWVASFAWFEDGSGQATEYFSRQLERIEDLDKKSQKMMTSFTELSLIESEIQLPVEFCLFKFGENITSKGSVYLDQDSAAECINTWKDQGNDLSLDYEHQAVKQAVNGPIPAAGWFKLGIKEDGLYAVGVEWTEQARTLLKNREYRYYSPAFYTDFDSKVNEIINCALTNIPATKDMKPLVASKMELQQGVEEMTQEELKAFLDQCKVMIDESLAVVPQMVSQALADYMAKMEPQEELSEVTQEVAIPEVCSKDEEIKKLSALVESLEDETLTASLMAHGADSSNAKRFNDLKVLSKMHKAEGQTIVDAVSSFAKENPDLFAAAKTVRNVDPKSLNTLSKPVNTNQKQNLFESWKNITPSRSKYIGGNK